MLYIAIVHSPQTKSVYFHAETDPEDMLIYLAKLDETRILHLLTMDKQGCTAKVSALVRDGKLGLYQEGF